MLLGYCQRQIERWRHHPKQHFNARREHHTLGILPRWFHRRAQQLPLFFRQRLKPAHLIDLFRRHHQQFPPLDHIEQLLRLIGKIRQVLRRQPQPDPELTPHLWTFVRNRARSGLTVMICASSVILTIGLARCWSRSPRFSENLRKTALQGGFFVYRQ